MARGSPGADAAPKLGIINAVLSRRLRSRARRHAKAARLGGWLFRLHEPGARSAVDDLWRRSGRRKVVLVAAIHKLRKELRGRDQPINQFAIGLLEEACRPPPMICDELYRDDDGSLRAPYPVRPQLPLTNAEAQEYMNNAKCSDCGARGFSVVTIAILNEPGWYLGRCYGCGSQREFRF